MGMRLLFCWCFLWLVISLVYVEDAEKGSNRNQKIINVCPGSDALFSWNSTFPLKYCQFGGAEGQVLDVKPLYVRVGPLNKVTKVNPNFSQQIEFEGDLRVGHAWFYLRNIQPDIRKDYRLSCKELGIEKGTKKKEFIINILKDCAGQQDSSAAPTVSFTVTSKPTATIIVQPTSDPTVTSKPPATTIVPPTHANNTPLIAGFSTFAVLAFITGLIFGFHKWCNNRECQKKGREEEKTSVTSEGVSDYVDKQSGTPKEV